MPAIPYPGNSSPFSPARSGAIAGALSVLLFTLIHDLLISDIWSMLGPMVVAGALCGICVGWSYARLTAARTFGSWLRYNLLHVALLVLLGAFSALIFEPAMSMAALVASDGPPEALIGEALPFTALFTVGAAAVLTALYGWQWQRFGVALLTCTVIVLLLGLNLSTIGLVSIPRGSLYLLGEMYGLILLINLAYALAFAGLERRALFAGDSGAPAGAPILEETRKAHQTE